MNPIYITGGQQRKNAFHKNEWNAYKKGIIAKIEIDNNKLDICKEYITPKNFCANNKTSLTFKCGTIYKNKLYVCTQTEIIIFSLTSFKQLFHLSLPFFNDVHHILPNSNGSLLIANTGLDMVIEINQESNIINEWSVIGEDPWKRFSKDIDYRKIETTKPHKSHPNYIFFLNKEIWVTRFEQRDAICINNLEKRIDIGIEKPHEGIVYGNYIFFTTVDGHIIKVDKSNLKIKNIFNLNEFDNSNYLLGWCRGLLLLDEENVIVGFSRIRPTKWRQNLRWTKHKIKLRNTINDLPTRICHYNLRRKRKHWEKNLEPYGINVIFSILSR